MSTPLCATCGMPEADWNHDLRNAQFANRIPPHAFVSSEGGAAPRPEPRPDWGTITLENGVKYAYHVPCRQAFIVPQEHVCKPRCNHVAEWGPACCREAGHSGDHLLGGKDGRIELPASELALQPELAAIRERGGVRLNDPRAAGRGEPTPSANYEETARWLIAQWSVDDVSPRMLEDLTGLVQHEAELMQSVATLQAESDRLRPVVEAARAFVESLDFFDDAGLLEAETIVKLDTLRRALTEGGKTNG